MSLENLTTFLESDSLWSYSPVKDLGWIVCKKVNIISCSLVATDMKNRDTTNSTSCFQNRYLARCNDGLILCCRHSLILDTLHAEVDSISTSLFDNSSAETRNILCNHIQHLFKGFRIFHQKVCNEVIATRHFPKQPLEIGHRSKNIVNRNDIFCKLLLDFFNQVHLLFYPSVLWSEWLNGCQFLK